MLMLAYALCVLSVVEIYLYRPTGMVLPVHYRCVCPVF